MKYSKKGLLINALTYFWEPPTFWKTTCLVSIITIVGLTIAFSLIEVPDRVYVDIIAAEYKCLNKPADDNELVKCSHGWCLVSGRQRKRRAVNQRFRINKYISGTVWSISEEPDRRGRYLVKVGRSREGYGYPDTYEFPTGIYTGKTTILNRLFRLDGPYWVWREIKDWYIETKDMIEEYREFKKNYPQFSQSLPRMLP